MGLLAGGGGGKAGLCFAEGNSALTCCMKPQCNPKEVCRAVPGGDNLPNRGLQCNVVPSVTCVSSGCLQTTDITLWEMELWQPDMQELQAQPFQTSSALHTAAELLCRLLSPHQGAQLSLRLSDCCWHRPGRFELCQLSGVIHPSPVHVSKHAPNQHISTHLWFLSQKTFSCHCCGSYG